MMHSQHVPPMMTSEGGIQNVGKIYWIGLIQSMSVVTIMFLIFGLALLQGMMLPDALGYGNCQTRTNISVASMMLNLNIAENIPNHENTQRKLDARGFEK
jgi:hypothetical protein